MDSGVSPILFLIHHCFAHYLQKTKIDLFTWLLTKWRNALLNPVILEQDREINYSKQNRSQL